MQISNSISLSSKPFFKAGPPTDPYFSSVVSLLHFDPTATEDVYFGNVSSLLHFNADDQYFGSTVLLMHMDGSDNGTTFTDVKGKTVTRAGDVVTKTGVKKFGTASAYFDGAGDYLSVADSADLRFGAGDFTVEAWVYVTTFAMSSPILTKGVANDGFFLGFNEADGNKLFLSNDTFYYASTVSGTANTWMHVAATRSGTTLRLFLDGVKVYEATETYNFNDTAELRIGRGRGGSTNYFTGYIDDLRITKGVARYTADFSVPTAAFPDATGGLTDVKGNTWTATGNAAATGSAKFGANSLALDGTGDYITTPYTTAKYDWFAEDFSIEGWVYLRSVTGASYSIGGFPAPTMIGNMSPTSLSNFWSFGPTNTRTIAFYYYNGSTQGFQTVETIALNTWAFIAFKRVGTDIKIYIDGVERASSTIAGTPQSSTGATLTVGSMNNIASNILIDDLRITKGANRTIVLPTAAFPDVIGGLTDVKGKTWTATGNAAANGAAKFGSNSLALDGAGDWITTPYDAGWNFGAGNFTVELWFNSSSTNQYASLLSADNGGLGWSFLLNSVANDGKIVFYENVLAPSLLVTTVGGYNDSQWHHVALVRNGNDLNIYVDGTSRAIVVTAGSTSLPGTLYIGGSSVSAARALTGQVDDVRITKGVARYTANFTPPTAAFPDA